ncbi:hypothetical protein EMIHUDRAFT_196834 [Emiliania huxleyi CCMP1516]|uniref:RNA helicase n=2 Tax=Emiliania huxleyi TaxID=2903 RepID=A0A0D3IT92_EMIH1|nr:hypothetical protein EMIHUDRAFT_196834 [Emiliania huxleyi CCMP1516]EOD14477.1 hypothetical protein EMIHUDRAFT_196834 [Emiliania huxleyi CCMP1516]|eukprot:XP_005766906.1 hypothetical protein EMIHUDRAFT_196834 [Emiliania huxleyi CCMP1516]
MCVNRSCLARDDVDASLGTAVSLVEPEELPYLLDLSLYLGRPVAAVPSEADSGGARAAPPDPAAGCLVLGRFPVSLLSHEVEQAVYAERPEAAELARVASRASIMYRKTRGAASKESARRARSLPAEIGVHPLLAAADDPAAEASRKKAKKKSGDDFRDAGFFMPMSKEAAPTDDAEEFLRVGVGDRVDKLGEAVLDLLEDERDGIQRKRSVMRWDARKKKYVRETLGQVGAVADLLPSRGGKRQRDESGNVISAKKGKDGKPITDGELYNKGRAGGRRRRVRAAEAAVSPVQLPAAPPKVALEPSQNLLGTFR